MKKSKLRYVIAFATVYMALLVLLTTAESQAEGAMITTIWEAFWYSLTTLTTVGYGDYYPITSLGRVTGLIFMLFSAGFFGFIISMFVSKMSGFILPGILLKLNRNRNWYIFTTLDENSLCMADSIVQSDDDGMIIFCGKKEKIALEHTSSQRALFAEFSIEDILEIKAGEGKSYVLSMGDTGLVDCQNIIKNATENTEIYCETDIYLDSIPAHTYLFNHYMCMARFLWSKYPLRRDEKKIVFVGCEKYGNYIIEQALLVNVDSEIGNREYHIFEHANNFLEKHKELSACFGINEKINGMDTIYFHEEDPFEYIELLKEADRIIVCGDSDADNAAFLGNLAKYVPYTGMVYVRQEYDITLHDKKMVFFGANKDVLSYDIVIRDLLTQKAKDMHADYCANNPDYAVPWETLSNFTRRSNMSVADHIQTKLRILLNDDCPDVTEERLAKAREIYAADREKNPSFYRRIEHERWMRFHTINNWSYAEVRCNEKRKHTMIIPFDQLSLEDQAKDDYGWEIL